MHPIILKTAEALLAHFEASGNSSAGIVDLATLVASADGNIDGAELKMLEGLLVSMLGAGVEPATLQRMLRSSARQIDSAGIEPSSRALGRLLVTVGGVDEGLTLALGIAYVSDGISPAERAVINGLANGAEVDAGRLASLEKAIAAAIDAG